MSGAHFVSLPEVVKARVASRQKQSLDVAVKTFIHPSHEAWYSVDLHHHSDIGDGNTSPEDLVKSQLASRLDLTLVSDHDSTDNHLPIKRFSDARNIGMIPSLEVSPGWGHLNILPMPLGGEIIEPSLTVGEIIAQAHARNALVIVNHPYTDYGYFNNREIAPGGYDADFDLIELQPTMDLSKAKNTDTRTLAKAMELWTDHLAGKNKAYYLTGGSDSHDVASPTLYSGMIRTYAKVEGDFTPASYIESVAKGRSYASMGPLFFPKGMEFGETLTIRSGQTLSLKLDAFAVHGLESVDLYTSGTEIGSPLSSRKLDGSRNREALSFDVKPTADTWYNFIAKDAAGRVAVSNPVWVHVTP
nr:CehA/McbA family metallohydrolase [Desulfobotulus pelophilus]